MALRTRKIFTLLNINLELKLALMTKKILTLLNIILELKWALRKNIFFTEHKFRVKIG